MQGIERDYTMQVSLTPFAESRDQTADLWMCDPAEWDERAIETRPALIASTGVAWADTSSPALACASATAHSLCRLASMTIEAPFLVTSSTSLLVHA